MARKSIRTVIEVFVDDPEPDADGMASYRVFVPHAGVPDFEIVANGLDDAMNALLGHVYDTLDGSEAIHG